MKYTGRQGKSKGANKFSEKEIKDPRKENHDGWKENTPGLQRITVVPPPSGRYGVPSHACDATGITRNKQQPEERGKTKLTK